MNLCMIVGRLGQDPEMRYTANGKAVVELRVAADSGFGDNKETEWFSVIAWEKAAEACAAHLVKGSQVAVRGRLKTRSWERNDGGTAYKTELISDEVKFLDRKAEGGGDSGGGERQSSARPQQRGRPAQQTRGRPTQQSRPRQQAADAPAADDGLPF